MGSALVSPVSSATSTALQATGERGKALPLPPTAKYWIGLRLPYVSYDGVEVPEGVSPGLCFYRNGEEEIGLPPVPIRALKVFEACGKLADVQDKRYVGRWKSRLSEVCKATETALITTAEASELSLPDGTFFGRVTDQRACWRWDEALRGVVHIGTGKRVASSLSEFFARLWFEQSLFAIQATNGCCLAADLTPESMNLLNLGRFLKDEGYTQEQIEYLSFFLAPPQAVRQLQQIRNGSY